MAACLYVNALFLFLDKTSWFSAKNNELQPPISCSSLKASISENMSRFLFFCDVILNNWRVTLARIVFDIRGSLAGIFFFSRRERSNKETDKTNSGGASLERGAGACSPAKFWKLGCLRLNFLRFAAANLDDQHCWSSWSFSSVPCSSPLNRWSTTKWTSAPFGGGVRAHPSHLSSLRAWEPCFSKVPRPFRARKASCQTAILIVLKSWYFSMLKKKRNSMF